MQVLVLVAQVALAHTVAQAAAMAQTTTIVTLVVTGAQDQVVK
jgi:hypothetical protein